MVIEDMALALSVVGNENGTIAELEVVLKSVLLNAPRQRRIRVFILGDTFGSVAARRVLDEQAHLNDVPWHTDVEISVQDVQEHFSQWQRVLTSATGSRSSHSRPARASDGHPGDGFHHTFGTYLKMFLHEALPATVHHALFLDLDCVVLTDLEALWQQRNPSYMFQWAPNNNSGVLLLNLPWMRQFLSLASAGLRAGLQRGDPTVRKAQARRLEQPIWKWAMEAAPMLVGTISQDWNIAVADSFWRAGHRLPQVMPNASCLHFNGGGNDRGSWFETSAFAHRNGWRVALYYVDLPWAWLRSFGRSASPFRATGADARESMSFQKNRQIKYGPGDDRDKARGR